jgi:hypothetical protein
MPTLMSHILHFGAPFLSAWVTSSVAFAAGDAPKGSANETEMSFVGDWSATGSGCRGAKGSSEGNTTLLVRPPGGALPSTWTLVLQPSDFRLVSPLPRGQEKTTLTFAKECSLRLALLPDSRVRIRNVTASTRLRVGKGTGTKAWTLAELQLGNLAIARHRADYGANEAVSGRVQEVRLIPGRTSLETMPETKCGQAKVLGLDLILAAERATENDRVDAGFEGESAVEILVDVAPCGPS